MKNDVFAACKLPNVEDKAFKRILESRPNRGAAWMFYSGYISHTAGLGPGRRGWPDIVSRGINWRQMLRVSLAHVLECLIWKPCCFTSMGMDGPDELRGRSRADRIGRTRVQESVIKPLKGRLKMEFDGVWGRLGTRHSSTTRSLRSYPQRELLRG